MKQSWHDRVKNMEMPPPENVWTGIANELNTSSADWSKRVFEYQITPGAAYWETISRQIDNNGQDWEKRIQEFEVSPPHAVWNRLKSELDQFNSTRVRTLIKPWTLAAAAIVCIAAGLLFYFSQQKETAYAANTVNTIISSDTSPQPRTESSPTAVSGENTALTATKVSTKSDRTLHGVSVTYLSESKRDAIVSHPSSANYVTICGPNNEPVKVSTKFIPVLGYLNNHSDMDNIISGCEDWKQRVCEWRDKMLNASVIPASSNFFDIIDLTETLSQE